LWISAAQHSETISIQGVPVLKYYTMGVGVEVKHNAYLISTLDGSELHAPFALLPRKEFPVPTG
jgi:hypothetical protein